MNYLWNALASHDFEFFVFLAAAAVKTTLLLGFVGLACLVFRRFSAAARHLLWTSVLCAALLLPFLSFAEFWEVPILPASTSILNAEGADESSRNGETIRLPEAQTSPLLSESFEAGGGQKRPDFQTSTDSIEEQFFVTNSSAFQSSMPAEKLPFWRQTIIGILVVWFIGALILLFRLLAGLTAANLLARRAERFQDEALNELFSSLLIELNLKDKVRLLRGESRLMPIVCGILRPSVLLPAEAEDWSEKRRRAVLLHELTHIRRHDCLTQILAQTTCAFYWFNPLVWYAARRLRIEREQACDDYVLSVGTKPSDYAGHLLEIARSMRKERRRSVFDWSQTNSVAMARESQLEMRLRSILSKENKRGAMSRPQIAVAALSLCVALFSLAIIRPTIVDEGNRQTSETVSNSETSEPEKSLIEPLLITDAAPPIEATDDLRIANSTEKQIKKSANEESLEGQTENLARPQADDQRKSPNGAEQNIERQTEITQNQKAETQNPAGNNLPIKESSESNPFVKANYERERNSESQNKSGDFIDEMASVGLTNLSIDELVKMKIHGVTADFIRGLRALGFDNLTPKTLANLRIYRVTPSFIEALAAAGYKGLTLKELTNARIYNVSPDYVKAIRDAGYPSVSIGQMVQFKIYRITPEFVRSARSRLGDLTPKQIISLKNAGVLDELGEKKKDTK